MGIEPQVRLNALQHRDGAALAAHGGEVAHPAPVEAEHRVDEQPADGGGERAVVGEPGAQLEGHRQHPLPEPSGRGQDVLHDVQSGLGHPSTQARLSSHFDRLEAEIGPRGYLVGDHFGVADLAAASVMTAILRPPEFPYPLPDPWPPELVELRQSLAHRPGYRWVMDMYAHHRGASSELRA